MYELIKLTDHDYYIDCPAKIGLTVCGQDAYLIDSGNDKDAGKKVKKILDANGWRLAAIYNTHSHADHIGGNRYLQTATGCKIYARGIERDLTQHPILEPSLLAGGYAPRELRHKFLMAEGSDVQELTEAALPEGLRIISLPGHSFDMVGFRTQDGTVYLADCLSGTQTVEKYRIGFLYDVGAYLETLEAVKTMGGRYFVPSHAAVTDNIAPLAQYNIEAVREIGARIASVCEGGQTFDAILQAVFSGYDLTMTFEQHALVGSTVRAYLTWLQECGEIEKEIADNQLLFRKI